MSVLSRLVRGGYPVVTPVIRDLYRLRTVLERGLVPFGNALKWWVRSKEYTNYTYDISDRSKKYLVSWLSNVLGKPPEEIERYGRELESDDALREFFLDQVRSTPDRYCADLPIKYGRRLGWYVLVRLLKPRVIVESGVDRGVGTCVLASAVLRNREEGAEGRVIGLDINPFAGRYVAPPYADVVTLIRGSSLDYLESMQETVDMFIHDSDHAPDYEVREYELVLHKLSPDGLLVSDNAELTTTLFDFAQSHSRAFWYWQEEVVDHVAAPGGIGLAVRR